MTSVLFVSDFDGTLTKKDTTYLSFRSTRKFHHATQNERATLLQELKEIGENYMNGYKTLVECLLKEYNADIERNSDKLGKFLTAIDQFNLDSRCKIAKQKYFEDFVYDNVEELKQEIEFHPHAMETLENLQKQENIDCKILSVNWFPELLKSCVNGIISEENIITSTLPLLKGNHVDFGKVSTAHGKGEWLRKWNEEYHSVSVYLGDSLTDLPALLEADYGIIFGSNKQLIEVTKLFNIEVRPLLFLLDKTDNGCENSSQRSNQNIDMDLKCLYLTSSWEDVERVAISLLQLPAS